MIATPVALLLASLASTTTCWIRIIHFNDVYKLQNLAHLKSLVQKESGVSVAVDSPPTAGIPDRTLVVLSGDFCSPYLLSSLDRGVGMVDCLNEAGVTHVCLGNHEADISLDQLKARMNQSNFVWLNSNVPHLCTENGFKTKHHDIIQIEGKEGERRKICLMGLVTNDEALYRSDSFGVGSSGIQHVVDAARNTVDDLREEVDLFLPLTHLSIDDDRDFCEVFGKRFPLILGGHEHTIYNEEVNGSRILKAGQDAENAWIIDVQWKEGKPDPVVNTKLVNTRNYPASPKLELRAAEHLKVLDKLEGARLFRIEDWIHERTLRSLPDVKSTLFSTKNNRLRPNLASTVLATIVRMGLCCDCCLIHAGSIRGSSEYTSQFTYKDLKAEMPYSTEMIVVPLPGAVIEAALVHSRSGTLQQPVMESGGYLHTCNNICYSEQDRRVVSILGEPYNAERTYLVAIPLLIFEGLDNHVPILEWASTTTYIPSKSAATPAKLVIVRVFSALLWLHMGSFIDIDADMNGVLTKDEIRTRASEVYGEVLADMVVENVLAVADMNNNGTVSPLEVMIIRYVVTDILDHICTQEELTAIKEIVLEVLGENASKSRVEQMIDKVQEALDRSQTRSIQREDILHSIGQLKTKDLFI